MSFSSGVQWWEDWQLRLLVLASLFFQYFLFAAAIVRKLRVPPWFRALIWLAYQGGDVVAIYALATLLSLHKEKTLATNPADSGHLDTLWAPVLLLHLGGQDGITAYSIEDNENWRRHLLLAVCQITVAVYVFRKSWWSGDRILLRAAILLFIPGIIKCLEKPWALKNATVESIMNSTDSRLEATLEEDDGLRKDIYSQEEYVQAAAECVAKYESRPLELFEDEVADQPYHLFVDLGHPYSIRLQNLQLVAPRSARADVHGLVRSWLSKAFDRLYTKHKASFGGLLRAAVVLLTFVDIGLFQRSHRGVYEHADVVVTYVLLCGTAALEFVSACLVLGSGLPPPDDKLAQYNLVGYLARYERHPRFWALVGLVGAKLQLNRLWCTAAPQPSLGITRLVYDHVAGWWKDYKSKYDAAAVADGVRAFRRFNDSRGQWTLEKEKCLGRRAIEESMRMPFDESVLLWHLATEFCYFDHVDAGNDATRHSRMVSNYMAYLLFVEPEMLIPGARSKLFTATYHELRKMLKPPPEDEEVVEIEPMEKKAPPPKAKNEMVRKVIQKVKTTIDLGSEDLVHKAWAVAHELMEFAKVKEMEFIQDQNARKEKMEKLREELMVGKGNDISSMLKEIEDARVKEFIDVEKKKRQTEEEARLTQLLENAKNNAQEIIKNDEKMAAIAKEMEKKEEEEKKQMVKDFSDSAQAVTKEIELPLKDKQQHLTEMKKRMVKDFSNSANAVIKEIKHHLEDEEKQQRLMELKKQLLKKFSNSVHAVINEIEHQFKEEEKKQQHLTVLMDRRNLITNMEDLLKIRAREHGDDKMWAVIQGVWVEMLCFSAGRCRGYLHAKSLGNGGEYLSYIWLLLSYMGMETMPERMQRPELPTRGDTGDLVKTPTEEMEEETPQVIIRRRGNTAPTPPASSRPPGDTTAEPSARTAQAQRLVVTPMPAMSSTAVVPVGDDMV